MGNRNRDEVVNLLKWPMISCGIWPRTLTKNPILSKVNFVYSLFVNINYVVCFFALLTELIRLITKKYPIEPIITSVSLIVTATKITLMMIIFFKNGVFKLLDVISKKEEKIWEENDKEITTLFVTGLKMPKLFAKSLWICSSFAVFTFNITGIINNNNLVKYNEAHNASLESHFLYQFWFPANKLDHLPTVSTLSMIFAYVGMTYHVTANVTVIMLCTHSASHLAILQHRLRNYIPDDFKKEYMDAAILTLKKIVLEHQYLIAYTTHINKCCKYIFMMEFVLASIDAGMVAHNIIEMDLSDMGWLFLYFVMLVIQIYSLAWSANEVTIQSLGVADAAYESRWYLLNKQGKQLTHIIIQQAQQRPLFMTIGPFGPMTMETFLLIIKAAYSYVSVMEK